MLYFCFVNFVDFHTRLPSANQQIWQQNGNCFHVHYSQNEKYLPGLWGLSCEKEVFTEQLVLVRRLFSVFKEQNIKAVTLWWLREIYHVPAMLWIISCESHSWPLYITWFPQCFLVFNVPVKQKWLLIETYYNNILTQYHLTFISASFSFVQILSGSSPVQSVSICISCFDKIQLNKVLRTETDPLQVRVCSPPVQLSTPQL